MDINLDIKKILPGMKGLFEKTKLFLAAKRQWIIVIIAALLLFYCGYLWYIYIANPHWSDVQKQEYINTRQEGAAFDQKKLDAIISEAGRRKNEYTKTENAPDIFRLK